MKSIKSMMLGGAVLLALPMFLTSCDEIIGELDNTVIIKNGTFSYATTSQTIGNNASNYVNPITIEGDGKVTYSSSDPTIAEVDPETGAITPHKAGTVTITATITDGKQYVYETKEISYTLKINYPYLKWDDTTKKLVEAEPLDETTASIIPAESDLADFMLGDKLLPAGTYIIAEDMTFNSTIRLSGNVNIILTDGKTLTFNNSFFGYDGDGNFELNVYGQSENSGKLIIKDRSGAFKPLNIYGGIIEVGETGNSSDYRFADLRGMNVYGGKVTVFNHKDGTINSVRIQDGYKLAIYGGEMTVDTQHTGGTSTNCTGISGDVEINDGKLTVTSVKSSYTNANAIYGNLTVNGGTVSLYGGPNAGQDNAVTGTITAGAGVTLEESDDATSWTTISGTSSNKMYIRTKQ